MNTQATMSLVFLFACEPATAEVQDILVDEVELDEPNLSGSGDDGWDDVEELEPQLSLQSGTWVVEEARLAEDPCDWDFVLSNYFGISLMSLLPEEFDIDAEEGAFSIKATDYGAAGTIDCMFEGDSFSCEAQSVAPEAYSLGAIGWLYSVDFTGQAVEDGRLSGAAVVSFPSVSGEIQRTLEYYDIDPADCTQVVELNLVVDN
ncbi:MAG: hypothetical protein ACI8S6_001043 [Myxococcota bacterium]